MIDLIRDIFAFVNPDKLAEFVSQHGGLIYAVLFGIIFCETGLVIMPFLPGDSLLFAIGAVAAIGKMNVWIVIAILLIAAMLGDNLNYWVGRNMGPKIFRGESSSLFGKLLSRKHLDRSRAFFDKHGGKSVILGHFAPIIRTFVPFIAGASRMNYRTFVMFNTIGVASWVLLCVGAGYFFGNIPFVKQHFELVVLGIVAVSLLPIAIELVKARLKPVAAV